MSEVLRPGAGIVFMKIGIHAGEPLESIIARKTLEIAQTGYGMWGYGGNTCHPTTMVQPFAETYHQRNEPITLCMNEMQSNHFGEKIRAEKYSVDDETWKPMPATINVVGSRFALVIEDLRREDMMLSLDHARVQLGMSKGRVGSQYIQGRADKACFEMTAEDGRVVADALPKQVRITYVARLRPPYAVFVK